MVFPIKVPAHFSQALRAAFSTSGSLGLGLPGVRRLMDEFEITSQPGQGTTVAVKKWRQ
jgi:serine/threonine-protein kinase RsbT